MIESRAEFSQSRKIDAFKQRRHVHVASFEKATRYLFFPTLYNITAKPDDYRPSILDSKLFTPLKTVRPWNIFLS